jgi:hypothetical protein
MAQQRQIKCVMCNWTVGIWHNRGKLNVLWVIRLKNMAQQREITCVMGDWTVRIWHSRGKLNVFNISQCALDLTGFVTELGAYI